MNDNDIRKCKKNGYVWSSDGKEPKRHTRDSFLIYDDWLSALDCTGAHPTRAEAQADIDERNRKILRDTMIKELIQQRYDDGGRVELKHLEDFSEGMVVQVNWHNPNGIQPFTIKGNNKDCFNKDCFENIVKKGWAFYSLKGAEAAAAEENRVERIKWCLEHQHSPITEKQSEDLRGEKYYVIGKRGEVSPTTTIDISAIREGRAFWHGKDANAQKQENVISSSAQAAIDERKRKARIAEYRKRMEPITPEQANDLRIRDRYFVGTDITADALHFGDDGVDKSYINKGLAYWTREAAEAALAKQAPCADLIDADDDVYEFDGHRNEYFGKVHSVCPQMVGVPRETCGKDIRSTKNRLRGSKRKSVESHEKPIGETQAKEVVTDETQDAEPVKWAEQKGAGSVCETGEDVSARYITPEWKAWKERHDAKAKQETPKPTTVRGWLETIPDPAIRDAALRQCIKLNDVCSSLDEAIIEIVDWASTDEGIDFWEECFIAAQNNTTWPSYPPKAKQDADGWTKEEIDKAAFKPREWTDIPQHIVSRNPGSKYHRTIHGVSEGTATVDVYNVLEAFGVTCPACQHAIKKLLCPGLCGKGSRLQDLTEAAASIARAIELEKQRGEGA